MSAHDSKHTRQENIHFLYHAIKQVWMAAGAVEEHAHYVADGICFAHKQGKLNQGLGVYEAIDIPLQMGILDINATPEIVDEGPTWVTVDGHGSTGYWCLNIMAEKAMEKAQEFGISIAFGGNHNDAGSFSTYVKKAFDQGMFAMASNNSVPLTAPFGGMRNVLSNPPFDAMVPAGKENPIWTSVAMAEFYDADVAEAAIYNKPLKGKWLIDPITGDLSDDVTPYAKPVEGYGRVWDCTAAGQLETPRTYAMNMWLEGLNSIINPLGVSPHKMPTIDDFAKGKLDGTTAVGGSFFLCIDPSKFGSLDKVKERSDSYISAIEKCPPRPGHSVRVPGSKGYQFISNGDEIVDVLSSHWQPFFENIAGRYGLSEEKLRKSFSAENNN